MEKIAERRILRFNISAKYYLGDEIKEDKVDRLRGTSGAEYKCLQNFDGERRKTT